ncbi:MULTISPECIES: hypothetical protein [Legionella]|uniref:Uncharacterized protein n=1 Tax=Legionella resiliens TaxID=2905958 RepID=A0ABS8X2N9_9GAMM|nr:MULTISPECIES: hypothetical protein [unclassified Legionella]MCE0722025.1 hypothetical protein [Legionella sp. 9fVS26]MCE3531179.1 hypothetical protein [Legionella sp. 8cVS16]QLZ70767.1 hypothetical protein FOLKNPGA_03585 [Legionella sp. PC1000]
MGWADKFWTATNWVLDTTVHVVADTMNTCGTLACTLGGAAYALSNVLPLQEVNAAYYGGVHAVGNFSLGINVTNLNYYVHEWLPVSYSNQVNNDTPAYNLTEYVSSGMVSSISAMCIGSGIVLKTLGANINHWQENREERRFYAHSKRIQITSPQLKEYLYVSAEAFSSSISTAMLSNAVAAAVLYFSGKVFPDFTYPPSGKEKVFGEHYNGAVITQPFNVTIDLGESNFTVPLYFENLNVLLKKSVDAALHATYGGGFFFKPSGATQNPPLAVTEAVSSTVGASAYLASNFFAAKSRQLHSERIHEAEANTYILINS